MFQIEDIVKTTEDLDIEVSDDCIIVAEKNKWPWKVMRVRGILKVKEYQISQKIPVDTLQIKLLTWVREHQIALHYRAPKIDSIEYREKVRSEDPSGNFCSKCGRINDHWDDCGWFMAEKEGYGAVCKACWKELGCTTGER